MNKVKVIFSQPVKLNSEGAVKEVIVDGDGHNTIERNMQIDPDERYEGGARWSCQKLHVEIDEGGNILGFVDGVPAVGGK